MTPRTATRAQGAGITACFASLGDRERRRHVTSPPGRRRHERLRGGRAAGRRSERACNADDVEGRRLAKRSAGPAAPVAAVALTTSSPLKVVRGGRINGDVERLPADTERRLEELERAGIDGFDRSLIPRVEWL